MFDVVGYLIHCIVFAMPTWDCRRFVALGKPGIQIINRRFRFLFNYWFVLFLSRQIYNSIILYDSSKWARHWLKCLTVLLSVALFYVHRDTKFDCLVEPRDVYGQGTYLFFPGFVPTVKSQPREAVTIIPQSLGQTLVCLVMLRFVCLNIVNKALEFN